MGERRSPHRSPSPRHCLQEGRDFISWAAVWAFYLLSPFSQSHRGSHSLLSCFQPSGQLSQVGKETGSADAALRLHFGGDGPVASGDRPREADLHPSPRTGSGSKQQTDALFNSLSSTATWMGCLVGSDKLCDMKKSLLPETSYQVESVSSEIFNVFSRPKALLLLHFRTDSLAVSILLNTVSPQKSGLYRHYKKLNRVSDEIKFNYVYLMTGMCF